MWNNSFFKKFLIIITDIGGFIFALNISYYVRMYRIPDQWALNYALIAFLPIMYIIFYVFELYDIHPYRKRLSLLSRSLLAVFVLSVGTSSILFLTPLRYEGDIFGRGTLLLTFSFFAIWVGLSRHFLVSILKKRTWVTHWLFIGNADNLGQVLRDINKETFLGKCSIVIKDSAKKANNLIAQIEKLFSNELIYYKEKDINRVLDEKLTGIVFCGSEESFNKVQSKLLEKKISGTRIYDITDYYEKHLFKIPVLHIHKSWFILSHGFDLLHNPYGLRIKNVMDIIISSIMISLSLPFMLLTSILILLESGFPIVYKQTRTGVGGKTYTLFKFRSMKKNAEKKGAQWASKKDNRVTPLGRFLRKTRLDELPQLFNILKGEMSFIGPRPERPEFDKELEKVIPHYSLRYTLKPGITGWAQVNYPYGASIEDSREKLQYDLFYIKNYSIFLDLTILIKTVKVIFHLKGR